MTVPNQLSFWIDVDIPAFDVDICISGDRYPQPVWADQRNKSSETLSVNLQGLVKSTMTWASIDSVTVRGFPAGARIRCWQMPFNLPAVYDPLRPFTHSAFRYQTFPRYWELGADALLKEMYMEDNLAGLAYAQSYAMPVLFSDIAVEPNTWGMLACAGASLYYSDRRQPLPGNLSSTALRQEPLYGLDCYYDQMIPGSARFLSINPVAYGGADNLNRWRYLVSDPNGQLFVILPDGTYAPYSGGSGWQIGAPVSVSIPLLTIGTYVITLECMDLVGNLTSDNFPYPNLAVDSRQIDLSSIVPMIQGVAFDSRQQLWIWTGSFAVPLKPQYDGYILDASSRTLYLTDLFDQIQYE